MGKQLKNYLKSVENEVIMRNFSLEGYIKHIYLVANPNQWKDIVKTLKMMIPPVKKEDEIFKKELKELYSCNLSILQDNTQDYCIDILCDEHGFKNFAVFDARITEEMSYECSIFEQGEIEDAEEIRFITSKNLSGNFYNIFGIIDYRDDEIKFGFYTETNSFNHPYKNFLSLKSFIQKNKYIITKVLPRFWTTFKYNDTKDLYCSYL